jgi:orotidine-5'-phosphate decarboxylase
MVCSPKEINIARAATSANFKLIVPGIRPSGSAAGDQKRVMTPRDAIIAGANILVIGRPITEAADPVAAAKAIVESLS